ncbi:MAG: T9SS type A sorting domain-containing protein, partial [Bacteroidales bacterium]|nr:T9SS type A sorting domain-containing protein [Bacteroidales bacterium]
FISTYLCTFAPVGTGDVTFSTEEGGVASGTRLEEGTVVKYVATPAYGYELTSITLNSTEILDQKYQEAFSGEFTMNSSNEMTITFAELTATLTYAYSGSGYIEVWSNDVQEGELFSNEATIPFNSELYVFSYPQGEYELQSLTINGETTGEVGSYLEELVEYGSVYHSVVGDVAIEAVFTGPNLVGVEGTETETVSVYANDGTIFVSGFNGAVQVVNISGQVVKEVVANDKTQITMPQGIYFVVTDNQVTKVVVK